MSGKKWLDRLQVEKVPVLVCLTYADKLYAEHMTEDGEHPDKRFMKQELTTQLSVSSPLDNLTFNDYPVSTRLCFNCCISLGSYPNVMVT